MYATQTIDFSVSEWLVRFLLRKLSRILNKNIKSTLKNCTTAVSVAKQASDAVNLFSLHLVLVLQEKQVSCEFRVFGTFYYI